MKRTILAVIGYRESGKDSFADKICKLDANYKKVAISTPLIQLVCKSLNITNEDYHILKRKHDYKLINNRSVRNFADNLYEDIKDAVNDKYIWLNMLLEDFSQTDFNYIITDLRIPRDDTKIREYCDKNSIRYIKIKIENPSSDITDTYLNQVWKELESDFTIKNSKSFDYFLEKVEHFYQNNIKD